MPTSLQITILDGGGPMAGRSLLLNQTPIRFGRDLKCDVVLEADVVSRLHGQFEQDQQGQWALICFSANGLKLGRKPLQQNEQTPLEGSLTLTCGKVPLLQAQPIVTDSGGSAEPPQPSETASNASTTADAAGKKRRLIWSGVGLWIALIVTAGIVLSAVPTKQKTGSALPPAWTADQIALEINQPLRQDANTAPRDTTRAQVLLTEANQHFANTDTQQDALARAYRAYHEAAQHTEFGVFDQGLDQRRFQHARQALLEQIIETYDDAYALIQSRDWQRAIDYLDELNQLYDLGNTDSALIRHVRRLKAYCRNQGR